ncbi:hypothetical protein L0P88_04135 [Muricauda sp. SCSIO 64092]|nr:hypothetical protein [Muricauda sp. SCSIO 64092]UOY07744.1 hypothetical protein L0P88_04135 [Muricauda sp. SCSIO 64092]
MTLQKQISLFTEDGLEYSQADSHANLSQMQENDMEQMTAVISGQRCYEQYGSQSPLPWLVKTLLASSQWKNERCLLEWTAVPLYALRITTTMKRYMYDKAKCSSTVFVKTLKKKDIKFSRLLFRLRVSALPIDGTGFGLLLTPTTSEEVMDLDKFKKRMEKYPNGTTMPNLATQVQGLLPTPQANVDGRKPKKDWKWMGTYWKKPDGTKVQTQLNHMLPMLPTPNSVNYKGASSLEALEKRGRLKKKADNLADQFAVSGKTSQLNPLFVAEMMGFPVNWTVLPFQNGEVNPSKGSETP